MKHSLVSRVRRLIVADSEGNALVEMAVTLPLVMLVMTGIFAFSVAIYQKLQLAEAVSNAGHYLATSRGDHDPCANAVNAIDNGAPGLTASNISISMSLAGAPLPSSCPGSGTNGPSTTFSTAQGETVQVAAGYTTALPVFGLPFTSVNLGTQISEVVQ
jgi:Flp pilus assembly protein TadG